MMTPKVSVVVPTYRRLDLLERCLAALLAQDLPPDQYEILIADNAGDEATRELVACQAETARTAIRYVAANHARGPAAARNKAWQAARAEIIAFTDDDCLPQPGWLRGGLAALRNSPAAAATGRLEMPLPPEPTDYERDAAGLAQAEFVTANCFCRRAALEEVGGFDERFTAAWREDSDLQFSLLERGHTIIRAPDAVVVHPVRPAPWGISLRQQKKVIFNALLYKKHPQLYRQRIPIFPRKYYLMTATMLTTAAAAILGSLPLAILSGAAWLWLTLRFCWRRLKGTSRHPRHIAEMLVTSALIPPVSLYWRLRGMWQYRVFFA